MPYNVWTPYKTLATLDHQVSALQYIDRKYRYKLTTGFPLFNQNVPNCPAHIQHLQYIFKYRHYIYTIYI